MTVRDVKRLIQYWAAGSDYDIKTAAGLLQKKRYPYALFFCHLAVEKLLKAVIVKKTGGHAPFSHNLLFLSGTAKIELSEKREQLLIELSKFNIEARYPDYTMNLYKTADVEYTRSYLSSTKGFLRWLKKQSKIR